MDGGSVSALAAGEMEVPLYGGAVVLTSNLLACKLLSRHFGGVQPAMTRVAAGDIEAFILVVRAGLGIANDAEARARDVDERVFRTGILTLTSPLTDFLINTANGGKPIGAEDAEPEAASPPGKEDG